MSEVYEGDSRSSVESIVQTIVVYAVVIAIALVGGYYLAQSLIPSPKIGVINIEGPIGTISSEILALEINYVRDRDDIKGIVLMVNSPGGGASAGHDMYYQVRKLREEMPVVASIDVLAASAAYQIAIASNEIFAKPGSFVGSIGVFMGLAQPEVLSERVITTGPFKATAFSPTSQIQKLDLLLVDFKNSVVSERLQAPNPLSISADQVATGEIWVGIEAHEYGLIDKLGSKLDAHEAAAEMAGIEHYEVVDVRTELIESLRAAEAQAQLSAVLALYEELDAGVEVELETATPQWPEIYQLYIPLE